MKTTTEKPIYLTSF